MKLDLYQIDAFTDKLFGGNPACVVPLEQWLDDNTMLNIARENAVAETAFFIQNGNGYDLRWFTPEIEMDLCGHATLASAYVIKKFLDYDQDVIEFNTQSGQMRVIVEDELFTLDFPNRLPENTLLLKNIEDSLNIKPKEVLKARDYLLVYDSEDDIKNIKINKQLFDEVNLDPGGVIVTAKGDSVDFVSRFFTPQSSNFEDPVTGSAHCSLIPYWSEKLGKTEMKALQLSDRRGTLNCKLDGDRVYIGGYAKTYAVGSIWID